MTHIAALDISPYSSLQLKPASQTPNMLTWVLTQNASFEMENKEIALLFDISMYDTSSIKPSPSNIAVPPK